MIAVIDAGALKEVYGARICFVPKTTCPRVGWVTPISLIFDNQTFPRVQRRRWKDDRG